MNNLALVNWFRQSSPYINAHRDKTVVVMISSATIEHANFKSFLHDLAIAHNLGIRVVLVFGASTQIDQLCDLNNHSCDRYEGLRLTSPDTMEYVVSAIGKLRNFIETKLSMGLINSPMHQANINVVSGNFVIAQPMGVIDGIDHQLTGVVRKVRSNAIHQQLSHNNIVLIPPLGASPSGETFNLYAEDVAAQVAIHLNAEKIIFVTDGLPTSLSSQFTTGEATELMASGALNSVLNALFKQASIACERGVERAHLIDIGVDGSLLSELYTRDGQGILISADSPFRIRRANVDDINAIIDLIRPLELSGALVRRSRDQLETEIDQFELIEIDGLIAGCCALYPFLDDNAAEVACVATHPDYRGTGIANKLLNSAKQRASALNISKLFLLTTGSMHWFLEQGFAEADLSELPTTRRSAYNMQRNSKLMIMSLTR